MAWKISYTKIKYKATYWDCFDNRPLYRSRIICVLCRSLIGWSTGCLLAVEHRPHYISNIGHFWSPPKYTRERLSAWNGQTSIGPPLIKRHTRYTACIWHVRISFLLFCLLFSQSRFTAHLDIPPKFGTLGTWRYIEVIDSTLLVTATESCGLEG